MSIFRPGTVQPKVNNTGGTLQHKQVVVIDGLPGTVIKTETHQYDAPIAGRQTIAQNERCNFVVKGVQPVPASGLTRGGHAFIKATATVTNGVATFPISTSSASGRISLGAVTEDVNSGRGVSPGTVAVDFDLHPQTPAS